MTVGTSEPLLTLEDVAISFDDRTDVVAGMDLTIGEGEFVAVLGPSGCGKSTIMNVTAGLLRYREGRVSFDGRPVREVNTDVGYMTQGDTLLPWRTVHDNVATPLKLRKWSRDRIDEAVRQALDALELSDAAGKFPAQLSGGMRRRALLARSMIYNPKMLLMDEPFAALDAQLRQSMHRQLLESVRAQRQTVMFVTHDINEALVLADRVVLMGGTPARTVREFQVPFGRDRDTDTVRFEPEFVAFERDVSEALDGARNTVRQIR